MTVEFVPFRGQTIPNYRKSEIRKILRSIDNSSSFHANLQLIYNNPEHFQTVPFRVCSFEDLQQLAAVARSRTESVTIQGDIHQNFHASGIVINPQNFHKIPVYDTYIRVKLNGQLIHILLYPPTIATPQDYIVNLSHNCDNPMFIIPPILSNTL